MSQRDSRPDSFISTSSHHSSVQLPGGHANAMGSSSKGATSGHQMWTAYQGPVLFTGPDGNRQHRTTTHDKFQMVGEGDRSLEVTSQMNYLNRPPPGQAFPKAKNGQIGEIGWPVETFKLYNGI
ncbi:protein SPMIP2-like isoform X2 [Argopecten irradians]